MSFAASVASIILGLVFMGHIRLEARNDPRKAVSTSYFLDIVVGSLTYVDRPNSWTDYGTKSMVLRNLPSSTAYRMHS